MSEAAAATSEPKEEQQVSTESTDAGASAAEGSAELDDTDAEIEAMKARVAEMEEEAKRMSELSSATASGGAGAKGSPSALSPEQIIEQDKRSIYVGQVDYSVTEEELKKLFEACGPVNRCTILKDKYSGQPKGFAYIEFTSADSIANAMILNETEFKGRTLKITPKRTNVPGMNRGGRGGRGRGRGGPRGGFGGGGYGGGGYDYQGGYGPIRGRGRGRGRGGYHPYAY